MSASSANYRVDSEKQDMSRDGSEVEPKQGIEDTEEQLEAQHVENNSLEKWNSPSINTYRYLAANFGFIIMGMNDAAYGALIPYLEEYYDINYTVISLVFLAPFIGYVCSSSSVPCQERVANDQPNNNYQE